MWIINYDDDDDDDDDDFESLPSWSVNDKILPNIA